MALTIPEKRTRALETIANGKRTGRLDSKAVKSALDTLAALDTDRTYATEQHVKDSGWVETSHRATIGEHSAGFTINGELTAITAPPDAEAHDANLGWHEPTPDPQEQFNAAMRQTGETLGRLVRWMATGTTLESIGLRAVALGSVIAPEAFEDCTGSQQSIAAKFGLTRAAIQQRVSELRDLAPSFQSRNMRGQDTRDAARQRAYVQHQRAGHRMHTNAAA